MRENKNVYFAKLMYFVDKETEESGELHIKKFEEREDFVEHITNDFGNIVIKRIMEKTQKKFLDLYQLAV